MNIFTPKKHGNINRALFVAYFVFISIMQNLLAKLNSSDLEGDAKLQAVLFVICPPAQYPVLLNYVSLPIILIGISMEMKNTDEKVF